MIIENEGKKQFKATKNWAASCPQSAYKEFRKNSHQIKII